MPALRQPVVQRRKKNKYIIGIMSRFNVKSILAQPTVKNADRQMIVGDIS
jgi:hypothetical protein